MSFEGHVLRQGPDRDLNGGGPPLPCSSRPRVGPDKDFFEFGNLGAPLMVKSTKMAYDFQEIRTASEGSGQGKTGTIKH